MNVAQPTAPHLGKARPRWRLRFSLATLVLVTMLAGTVLGWWFEAQRRDRMQVELEQTKDELEYERKRAAAIQKAMDEYCALVARVVRLQSNPPGGSTADCEAEVRSLLKEIDSLKLDNKCLRSANAGEEKSSR
ncbi:MAG TPA: hypothetical protein VGP72_23000 [Planctomycetota bacterium]|jgi:hypothetical protein